MGTQKLTNATTQLYTKQPGDEGKTAVVIYEPECQGTGDERGPGGQALRTTLLPCPKRHPGNPRGPGGVLPAGDEKDHQPGWTKYPPR